MASIIEIVDEEDYSGLNEEVKHKIYYKIYLNPIFITRSVT